MAEQPLFYRSLVLIYSDSGVAWLQFEEFRSTQKWAKKEQFVGASKGHAGRRASWHPESGARGCVIVRMTRSKLFTHMKSGATTILSQQHCGRGMILHGNGHILAEWEDRRVSDWLFESSSELRRLYGVQLQDQTRNMMFNMYSTYVWMPASCSYKVPWTLQNLLENGADVRARELIELLNDPTYLNLLPTQNLAT